MGSNGSSDGGENKPRSRGGLDDTVPASEPPLDIHGQPMRSSRASIPPMSHERYRLGTELGRGGMGRVVEAFDTQLGRTVALKEVLPKGPSIARRFLREVEITARLEHASIVPLYDAGTSPDGRPFYVMRRVSGRPLDEAITRARGLGERLTLLPAVLAAIDAVAHAHKRGIIHRDIKPQNILVGELGETVVIDWGLAKVIGEEDDDATEPTVPTAADSLQTQAGAVFGTPGFMSPEQARGESLSPRSDVYALGATLYYLLAGSPPHAGDSATMVLGRTLKHDVVPLLVAAPGAPPDLVTIVTKALAFEAEDRYPNAGALSDDVRRFLAGQLVAAHRYTPRQRITRFAKRHRTSLGIAALAAVAVAGLAWFSVHRIMQERDVADAASKSALAEKRLAEERLAEVAERNDALLLTQARYLLESNPTEALAVVKQLPMTSVRLPEARAIGQAAVARGVWWGIQSTEELTTRIEMSPDGQQLLQVSRDHMVRVWDLERRRLVIARQYATTVTAIWIERGQVLVFGSASAPEILNPSANVSTPLPLAPFADVDVSDNGEQILVTDQAGVASWLELDTNVLTPLLGGRKVKHIDVAPEGTWAVVADDTMVVAVDANGKELVRITEEPLRVVTSRYRTFAVATQKKLIECTLDPTPTCVELGSPLAPRPLVIDLNYRGRELMMFSATGDVIGWIGGSMAIRDRVDQFMNHLNEAADEVMVVPSFTGKLVLLGRNLRHTMYLPVPVAHARVATRPKHPRVVVVGDGQILVADLDNVIPRRLPDTGTSQAVFADDKTLLMLRASNVAWAWVDLATGTVEPVAEQARGMPFILDVVEGRVLIFDDRGTDGRLVVLERGKPLLQIADGMFPWGRLLTGGTTIFGVSTSRDGTTPGDGRIFARTGAGEPRELVKVDGEVISATRLGPNRFAAISSRGELVRGDVTTGAIERANVDTGKTSFIGGESGGRAVIAIDDRLLLWDSAPREIAKFPDVLKTIARGDRGRILVTLMNHDVFVVELEPGAKPERLLNGGQTEPIASVDGTTLVASVAGRQLTIVELESANRWTLPMIVAATSMLVISPGSRHVVQGTHNGMMVWTLPTAAKDLAVWLDEHSNAVKIGDNALAWPWQVRTP